jgi:hypothetical protein
MKGEKGNKGSRANMKGDGKRDCRGIKKLKSGRFK